MDERKRIDIFFEFRLRELDHVCLMKYALERLGYRVRLIVYKSATWTRFCFLKRNAPAMAIGFKMEDNRSVSYYLNYYKSSKLVLLNMRQEQLFSPLFLETDISYPKDEAKKVYNLCWGDATKQWLLSHGMEERYLLNSGSVQMDFCAPEFHPYFSTRAEISQQYQLDENKVWNIFIASFTGVEKPESEYDLLKSLTSLDYHPFYKTSGDARDGILLWLEKFAIDHPDHEVIYRRHPHERSDAKLEALADKYPNFHAITEHSVRQWILVCDVINTWMSTSIVDAYYMKKPTCILRPVELPKVYDCVLFDNADFVTEYSVFEAINTRQLTPGFPVRKDMISHYYANEECVFAHKKLCAAIDDILKRPDSAITYDPVRENASVKARLKTLLLDILSFLWRKRLFPAMSNSKNVSVSMNSYLFYGIDRDIKNTMHRISKTLGDKI